VDFNAAAYSVIFKAQLGRDMDSVLIKIVIQHETLCLNGFFITLADG
jgi:hypothetical protein